MIYRYIYKITCTKGSWKDSYYYGQHTTKNINDGYKGSGTKLTNYYKKYPNDYIKEIICFCKSNKELNKKEYDIIHPHLNNPLCLNMCEGGHKNYEHLSEDRKKKISESMKKHCMLYGGVTKDKKLTIEHKNKIGNSLRGRINGPLSEEHKRKISISNKGHNVVNKGKIGIYKWMTNGKCKPVYTNEIDYYLSIGYHFGRK